jgi:hypothetical protein
MYNFKTIYHGKNGNRLHIHQLRDGWDKSWYIHNNGILYCTKKNVKDLYETGTLGYILSYIM